MSSRDKILDFIRRYAGRDDDQISAATGVKPRQAVNQICRQLEREGHLNRRVGATGKICNFLAMPNSEDLAERVHMAASPLLVQSAPTLDWFWEGNVADVVVAWLRSNGWMIVSQADTRSRQRGVDIHARSSMGELLVEVKGYPSRVYRDARRVHEIKRTNPSLQSQHWYAQALLKALRLQHDNPSFQIALAVPDFPTYRRLFDETKSALDKLMIALIFVRSSGEVETFGI